MRLVNSEVTLEQLQETLKPIDNAPVECDGASRLVAHFLEKQDISYEYHVGSAIIPRIGNIGLHHWVYVMDELGDTWAIDYRLRMWLGDYLYIPHGIFKPAGEGVIYQTRQSSRSAAMPECVVKVLMTPLPEECQLGKDSMKRSRSR